MSFAITPANNAAMPDLEHRAQPHAQWLAQPPMGIPCRQCQNTTSITTSTKAGANQVHGELHYWLCAAPRCKNNFSPGRTHGPGNT